MPFITANGIRLCYRRSGRGEPVLLIMGSSAAGQVWTMYQTPALDAAGFETVTFDNRGVAPSDAPPGDYAIADLVADTAGLIEALGIGPCHLVGASMGSMIAQELALVRPELVRSAVLIATRARSDVLRRAQSVADRELRESGLVLPARCRATRTALDMLSPATLNDEDAVSSWLDVFELSGGDGAGGQLAAVESLGDRRAALPRITVPCLAVAFADDRVCPPHLVAEVAGAIPGCGLVEIPDAGHYGYLERPDEVNTALVAFLSARRGAPPGAPAGTYRGTAPPVRGGVTAGAAAES